MKKYSDLTKIGKKRRLKKLAQLALEHYNINVQSLNYYDEYTNTFYILKDTDGKKYILKIFREETTKLQDNLAEIFCLNEIKRNSDIIVPKVLKAIDGNYITIITSQMFDTPKRIAIYEWIEGKLFSDHTTLKRFESVGAAMAKLHIATQNTAIPNNLNLRRWNKVFYFSEEKIVYTHQKYQHILDDDFLTVINFIVPYLNNQLEKIYEGSDIQLLHGDLNPWNILVYKEEIRFIDFEDNILGIPLHDIAITLFYYKHSENYDYNEVKKHLLKGYGSVRSIPEYTEFQLDVLIYARLVNFLNYVLVIEYDEGQYCKKRLKNVKDFIQKYARDEYQEYLKSINKD